MLQFNTTEHCILIFFMYTLHRDITECSVMKIWFKATKMYWSELVRFVRLTTVKASMPPSAGHEQSYIW